MKGHIYSIVCSETQPCLLWRGRLSVVGGSHCLGPVLRTLRTAPHRLGLSLTPDALSSLPAAPLRLGCCFWLQRCWSFTSLSKSFLPPSPLWTAFPISTPTMCAALGRAVGDVRYTATSTGRI